MKKFNKLGLLALILPVIMVVMIVLPILSSAAQPPEKVDLGATVTFAVLAGSEITNAGSSVIDGDIPEGGGNIGVSPGSSITGQAGISMAGWNAYTPPNELTDLAKIDLKKAYDDAAGRTVTSDLTGQNLGGLTLTTGVYSFSSSAQLTGELTLDAQGDPNAVFIFQIGSALTTESYSSIKLINEARYCRVFWQVTSSATLGTYSHFVGHIFALESITANTGVTVQGQLLAFTSAVTLDSVTIHNGLCAEAETTTSPVVTTTTPVETTTTPVVTTTTSPETTTTSPETTTMSPATITTSPPAAAAAAVTTSTSPATATTAATGATTLATVSTTAAKTTGVISKASTTTKNTTETDTSIPKTGNKSVDMLMLLMTITLISAGTCYAARKTSHRN